MMKSVIKSLCIMMLLSATSTAQEANQVDWLSFEQLEDSLSIKPKKVFIDFYTDWCTYCRKMDRAVFTKPEVISLLNEEYYAVRFNAEADTEVKFGSRTLVNDQIGKSRNPLHQIAQLLALREGAFTAPTMIILDEGFNVTARHFEYMDSKKLSSALEL